ncbi:hypothetical protein F7725_006506 [Dissostichus mawsoni]|uniref:CxC3 like cysteine cluster domain-containing protein n=1 Tax=Dissostichus mawsoni TaxID=36200 RepID=A0A7J5XU30_DISMA|nr:hypothetical protein F7725_006506 [Dissostichus mawsoni]
MTVSAASQDRRYDPVHEEGLELEHQDFGSLETHLQELRDTLTAVQVPEATDGTVSAWAQRQLLTDVRMKTARPMLFNTNLSAERIAIQKCHRCCAEEAVIRCLDCVPLDMEFLCATCDMEAHKRNIFHDREAVFNGFLEPIPPTTAGWWMKMASLSFVNKDVTVTPWKHISVVTINGRYNVCLPRKSCPSCSAEWTPEVKDLLLYRYWPASTSCQTLYKYDVFTSFEHMKVTAPAMSRQAFLKMLEHRSVQAGRRSFFEFLLLSVQTRGYVPGPSLCLSSMFSRLLAVCCDGNRKHYRFSKSKGTEEPPIYEGLFLAKDEEVANLLTLSEAT